MASSCNYSTECVNRCAKRHTDSTLASCAQCTFDCFATCDAKRVCHYRLQKSHQLMPASPMTSLCIPRHKDATMCWGERSKPCDNPDTRHCMAQCVSTHKGRQPDVKTWQPCHHQFMYTLSRHKLTAHTRQLQNHQCIAVVPKATCLGRRSLRGEGASATPPNKLQPTRRTR